MEKEIAVEMLGVTVYTFTWFNYVHEVTTFGVWLVIGFTEHLHGTASNYK